MESAARLSLDKLTRRFQNKLAVDTLSLEVASGELVALMGASGSGKTTTLRMVAGYEPPDSGRVWLEGKDITSRAPRERGFGMVFQHYALFPHMTVGQNVAFGLEGASPRAIQSLSGGEQQRVALARALVIEPPVLLLDEPLGALDARLRVDLQVELKRIQETLGVTFVYVTHDQDEALTMSDRVAVMRAGRIEQLGAPQELYEEPATTFVANFLGSSNLIPATLAGRENGHSKLVVGKFTLRAGRPASEAAEGDAMAMIRPERVRLEAHGAEGENRVPGMVEEVVYLGFHEEVRVRLATGALVKVNIPNDGATVEYSQGDPVAVHLPADCLRVLDAEA